MFSRFRHVFGVLFFLLVASCSGGGCSSGCGGCGGTTPLPGGFPKDKTIDNAASVRVSRPGLTFVEQNLPAVVTKVANAPGGVLGFDIPNIDPAKTQIADLSIFGKLYVDTNVCVGGPDPAATPPRCHASIGIGKSTFLIDAVKPNAIQLKATIPVILDDTPIEADVSYDPPLVGAVNHTPDPGPPGGAVRHSVDRALDVLAAGGLPHDVVVTHEFALEDVRDAIGTALDRRASGSIKVAFRP